jgi:membrane protease YdiL (CAAX protease family)
MNILITFGVAAATVCVLWAVQSAVLSSVNEPLSWPLQYTTRSPVVRTTMQLTIQISWLIMLIGTPLALGIRPLSALHQAFPLPIPWREIATVFAIMLVPICVGYLLFIKSGWLRFEPKFDRETRRDKLLRRFLTPLPLATLEEAVFRGVLLEQLLRSLPQSQAFSALAIVLSAAVFAVVHFIKPARGKPVWQGIYGYFTAGCLFGIAYVIGGRSLWLPIVMHATAIFTIEVARLYTVHKAPRWLAGFPECPHSGLVGSIVVLGMAVALVTLI